MNSTLLKNSGVSLCKFISVYLNSMFYKIYYINSKNSFYFQFIDKFIKMQLHPPFLSSKFQYQFNCFPMKELIPINKEKEIGM